MASSENNRIANLYAVNATAATIAVTALCSIFMLHLIPALFAGLITAMLIDSLARPVSQHIQNSRAKLLAALVIAVVVVGILSFGVTGAVSFVRSDEGIAALFRKMASILDDARQTYPWLASHLPQDIVGLRTTITAWLREHSAEMQTVGAEFGRALAHIVVGSIIGAMIAVRDVTVVGVNAPLPAALSVHASRFVQAFRRVVGAQARISAINTLLTALYLAVALPLAGVSLPFTKTMIALTFLIGMLPVVGNLMSNTVILLVSLSHSLAVAIASMIFLVVVHKLEYFLNARIVGKQIEAQAWELLLAMLFMESLFGLAGVAAAPVVYAWIKLEGRQIGWI